MVTILDLPIHPLAVHVPLVFVPLLLLMVLAYVAIPPLRRRIGWVVFALTILSPGAVFLAVWSGRQLADTRYAAEDGSWSDAITEHAAYGDRLLWILLGLAPVMFLFFALERGRRSALALNGDNGDTQQMNADGDPIPASNDDPASKGRRMLMILLGVIAVALVLLAGWMAFEVGHSGSDMVWNV